MANQSRIRERHQQRRRSRRSHMESPIPRSPRVRQRGKLSRRRQQNQRFAIMETSAGAVEETSTPGLREGSMAPQRLSQLTGITPAMERKLHAMGQTRFFQMAQWDAGDVENVAKQLEIDPGRIRDQQWIAQARRHG